MRLIRGKAALTSTVAVTIKMVVQRLWQRVVCTIVPTTAVRKPVEQLVSWRYAVVSMSAGLVTLLLDSAVPRPKTAM